MTRIPTSRRPVTPGCVLHDDFVVPLALTQGQLADALGVSRTTINEIIKNRRAITHEMALRLGHCLKTSAEYWLNLQHAVNLYDVRNLPGNADIDNLPVLVATDNVARRP